MKRIVHVPSFCINLRGQFQIVLLLGTILFFAAEAGALAPNTPPGPYLNSCTHPIVTGTTLKATCKDFFDQVRESYLNDYAKCAGVFVDSNGNSHPRFIFNIDGTLRCIIDFKKRAKNDKNDPGSLFDVISVSQAPLSTGGTRTLWRIDRPQVWHNVTAGEVDYTMITFQAGDEVSFVAGGCVQTGGQGQTWKRYFDPQGSGADVRYYGTVSIPGEPFGFAKIRDVFDKKYPIPAPRPGFPNILKLGYIDDELDDNGYYRHDGGNPTQCAHEGPAWVEVSIFRGVKGSQLSPHSLPFDLVWNVDTDEDENGLPINPQWNYSAGALAHQAGLQPHLIPICGAAFLPIPGGPFMVGPNTADILAKICTSMPYDFDSHLTFFYCSADPIPGHMNFSIATYTGQIKWDSASAPQGAFSDGDWSFNLTPPNGEGLAGLDDTDTPGTFLHTEFNEGEVGLPVMPFWKDLLAPLPVPVPIGSIEDTFKNKSGGLEGVVIGQVGLDGVHGGFPEIHPVYAMAVRLQSDLEPQRPDQRVEKWAFFLRNFGDEGFCSHNEHSWPKQPEYFISLPWPGDATQLISHSPEVVPWQDARTPVGIEVDTMRRFTLIRVGDPGVAQFGVGGTFEFVYKVTNAPKQRTAASGASRTPAGVPKPELTHEEDDEVDIENLSARIADPTTRAKFQAALKALPPMKESRRFTPHAPVQVPPTITERKHVPGAASKGIATRSLSAPNVAKERWQQEMDNLLKTYEKDLNLKPATPPQPPHPNAAQGPKK